MVGFKPRRFTGYKSLSHRVKGNGTVMGEVIKFPRRTRARLTAAELARLSQRLDRKRPRLSPEDHYVDAHGDTAPRYRPLSKWQVEIEQQTIEMMEALPNK